MELQRISIKLQHMNMSYDLCDSLQTCCVAQGIHGTATTKTAGTDKQKVSQGVNWGWDLAEWSERCASILKMTGSNPSGGSEFTLRSDLLLTARGGSTWALLIEFACLPRYPGNTLCSQRLEPPGRAGISTTQIPKFIYSFIYFNRF
jgi:hypothetical protein